MKAPLPRLIVTILIIVFHITLHRTQGDNLYFMNRKKFLSSAIGIPGLATMLGSFTIENKPETVNAIVPPNLKQGDYIGITSPAGYITEKEVQPAISVLEEWGFKIKIGKTIGKRYFGFGGTDQERRDDFQDMLENKEIRAILCARGGYGALRIIDQLDFTILPAQPKWIIGFSDITVLHSHLNRNYGIASIHSKMCNSFPDKWKNAETEQKETILSIKQALTGEKMKYTIASMKFNKTGKGVGPLVGGNLKTIETLAGSKSDLRTTNKILFVEDTGEYLYSIDRMFWNLKRSGKLNDLQGLIIGGFKVKPDNPGEDFGKSVHEIVLEKVKEFDYPVCFDFPVGHQKNNYALKCGIQHRLEVGEEMCSLREL